MSENQAIALQLRGEVDERKDVRLAKEARQIRDALQASNGYIARAAKTLGIPRSRLSMALAPRGRHAALGAWAADLRLKAGWLGGRPPG